MIYKRFSLEYNQYYELTSLLNNVARYYNYDAQNGVVYVYKALGDGYNSNIYGLTSDITAVSNHSDYQEREGTEFVYVKLPVIQEHIDEDTLVKRGRISGRLEFSLEDEIKLKNLRHILDPLLKLVCNCDLEQYLDYLRALDEFRQLINNKQSISNRVSQYTRLTKDIEIVGVYAAINNLLRKRSTLTVNNIYDAMRGHSNRYDRSKSLLNYKKGIQLLEQIN